MKRLFIAIELPDAVRAAIDESLRLFKSRIPGVKWVISDNLHLTLKFLGNTPEDQIVEIGRIGAETASGFAPMEFDLQGLGAFPSPARPRIIWAGLGGDVDRLAQLAGRLDQALSSLGFEPETRRFSAHITLARARRKQRVPSIVEQVEKMGGATLQAFTAGEMTLFESTLTRQGPIYAVLERFPFSCLLPAAPP